MEKPQCFETRRLQGSNQTKPTNGFLLVFPSLPNQNQPPLLHACELPRHAVDHLQELGLRRKASPKAKRVSKKQSGKATGEKGRGVEEIYVTMFISENAKMVRFLRPDRHPDSVRKSGNFLQKYWVCRPSLYLSFTTVHLCLIKLHWLCDGLGACASATACSSPSSLVLATSLNVVEDLSHLCPTNGILPRLGSKCPQGGKASRSSSEVFTSRDLSFGIAHGNIYFLEVSQPDAQEQPSSFCYETSVNPRKTTLYIKWNLHLGICHGTCSCNHLKPLF